MLSSYIVSFPADNVKFSMAGQTFGERCEGLAPRTERSFAALRMTGRTPLKSAHGKPCLQMSRLVCHPWVKSRTDQYQYGRDHKQDEKIPAQAGCTCTTSQHHRT